MKRKSLILIAILTCCALTDLQGASAQIPMILIGNEAANYWTRAYGLSPATQLAAMIKAAAEREAAKTQH